MKLTHYILSILAAGLFFSCTPKIDPIFDDTSANRIEEEIETVQEILLSSPNGWLMEYYPSSTQSYGGFNVLLNFQPGYRVTVASETAGADKTAVSTYTLKQSAGCVLSFDTYNEILHFFSDPSNSQGMGDGYGLEGDFEFTILQADEQIIRLKGKKSGSYMTMTPMSAALKWSDYLKDIKQKDKEFAEYYRLLYQDEEQSIETRLTGHTLCIYRKKGEETITEYQPFIITLTGCKFYQPVQLGNNVIEGLILNPDLGGDGTFIPSNDATGMFIPTYPSVNEMLFSRNWFFTYSGFSPYGQALWDISREALEANNDDITYCYLGSEINILGTYYAFQFICAQGHGYLAFDYELIGEDKISLKFSEEGSTVGKTYYTDFKFNALITPFGNDIQRTFTLTSDDKKSPNWIKFTDVDHPENYFTAYRAVQYYPMAN